MAECRSAGLWEDRALPVRVVSGGPGAGGGWHPAAARALGVFCAGLSPSLACPSSSVPSDRVELRTTLTSLVTVGLTPPIHPSNPISGRSCLFPWLVCGLWTRVLCLTSVHTTLNIKLGTERVMRKCLVNENILFLLLSLCPPPTSCGDRTVNKTQKVLPWRS